MLVTSDTAIFPDPDDNSALEAVKSAVVTVDIAPAIFRVLLVSSAAALSVIAVLTSVPLYFRVAAVTIPTSKSVSYTHLRAHET